MILLLELSVELNGLEFRPGTVGTPRYPGVVGRDVDHRSGWGIHFDYAHGHAMFIKVVTRQRATS